MGYTDRDHVDQCKAHVPEHGLILRRLVPVVFLVEDWHWGWGHEGGGSMRDMRWEPRCGDAI